MAHGHNAKQNHIRDWWGNRPISRIGKSKCGMKAWKKILHKIERQKNKQELIKELRFDDKL